MKIKVKTLVAIIVTAAVVIGGAQTIKQLQSAERIIAQIERTYPTEESFTFVRQIGFTSSSATEASLASEQQAIELTYQMIEEYADHEWTKTQADWTLANLYRKHGNWTEALRYFEKVNESDLVSESLAMHARQWIQLLDPAPPYPHAQPVLSGKLWIGDEPAHGAYVYMMPADQMRWYTPRPPLRNHYPMTVTNEQGEFQFYENITPGDYTIGVGIHPTKVEGYVLSQQDGLTVTVESSANPARFDLHFVPKIELVRPVNDVVIDEDTITFEWEPHPGAVTYHIGIGEVLVNKEGEIIKGGMLYFDDEWEGTTAVYKIEELRKRHVLGMGSYSDDGIAPISILGPIYPGGYFTWGVFAYDEHGNRLSSSSGIYGNESNVFPVFSLDEAGQLEGDRHLLAGNYDQAITAYEQEIDNSYALRALARIYYYGTDANGEEHKDVGKAIEYLKQVPDLTDEQKKFVETLMLHDE